MSRCSVGKCTHKQHQDEPILSIGLSKALSAACTNGENEAVSLYSFATILRILAIDNPAHKKVLQDYGVALEEPPADKNLLSLNSCWLQRGETHPTSVTLAELAALGVKPEVVEFRTGYAAAQAINAATNKGTQGMIPELLPDKELAEELRDALVVYLNTLCFKSRWQTEFNEQKTYTGNFYDPTGLQKADFMVAKETFDEIIGFDDICQATVGNCLIDGQTLFCAMMPKRDVTMKQVLDRLAQRGIPGWRNRTFELHLPKFSVQRKSNLSKLFPEIIPASMPGLGLPAVPVKVMQKAIFKINKKGVEAAAATMGVTSRSASQSVIFNRPFLALILNAADEPIFAAIVNKP